MLSGRSVSKLGSAFFAAVILATLGNGMQGAASVVSSPQVQLPAWLIADAREIAEDVVLGATQTNGWPRRLDSASAALMSIAQFNKTRGVTFDNLEAADVWVLAYEGDFVPPKGLPWEDEQPNLRDGVLWVAMDPDTEEAIGFHLSESPVKFPPKVQPIVIYEK